MRFLTLIFLFFSLDLIAQDRIEISILEQRIADNQVDSINPFVLRFCFYKKGTNWNIADNSLKYKKGFVCFDGKLIGSIEILGLYNDMKYERYRYMFDDTHYIIKACKNVPKIGKPSNEFSGFLDFPTYRPLVVSSTNNAKDPKHWKPYKVQKNDSILVLQYFKSKLLTQKYFNMKNSELFESLNKSYISNDSVKLISANLFGDYKFPCDTCEGVIQDTGRKSWFVINKNKIDFIGSDMLLVDAGDYDNDGQSEIIFKKEQYDYDAYVLFYDLRFQKEIGWRYH